MKERLKELRKRLGLTQGEFGERLGVSDVAISYMESGKTAINRKNLYLICATFDVNEDWLRDGTGEIFKEGVKKDDLLAILGENIAGMSKIAQEMLVEYSIKLLADEGALEAAILSRIWGMRMKGADPAEEYWDQENRRWITETERPIADASHSGSDPRPDFDFKRILDSDSDLKLRAMQEWRGVRRKYEKPLKTKAPDPESPGPDAAESPASHTAEAAPPYGERRPGGAIILDWEMAMIPHIGKIAAGEMIELYGEPDSWTPFPKNLLRGNLMDYFTAEIKGASMTEAGIRDGDRVVLRKAEAPINGSIMLVTHADETALKRIKIKEKKRGIEVHIQWEDGSGRSKLLDDEEYEIHGELHSILSLPS